MAARKFVAIRRIPPGSETLSAILFQPGATMREHRQMHYGGIDVVITGTTFELTVDGQAIEIPRLALVAANQ
jgi:hypothetical protein